MDITHYNHLNINGDLADASLAIKGLRFSRLQGDERKTQWLNLPKTFLRERLLIDTQDIANLKTISK